MKRDICIVGGGAAGIAAAYTAALAGRDVVLIEKNNYLGGMATAAYVGTICGAYFRSRSDKPVFVADGFMRMFTEKLARQSNSSAVQGKNGLWFLPYMRDAFVDLALAELKDVGVDVLFDAEVITRHVDESKNIMSVDVISNQKKLNIAANYFIDCTGHAILANHVDDSEIMTAEQYQAGAYVFGLSGLPVQEELPVNLALIKQLRSEQGNTLSQDGAWLALMPGSLKDGTAYFKLAIPLPLRSTEEIKVALHYAKLKARAFIKLLQNESSIFHKAKLTWEAPAVGVRTGPRYIGKEILRKVDVLQMATCEQSMAKAAWPIEYWGIGTSVTMEYFDEMACYDIPIGCTQSPVYSNLRFAGRHIAAEAGAIASARVMGTCMQMGENVIASLT